MKISPLTATVICITAGLAYIIIKQYRDAKKAQAELMLLKKHLASTVITTASIKEATIALSKNQKGIAERLVEQSNAVNGIAAIAGRTEAFVKSSLHKTNLSHQEQSMILSGKQEHISSIPSIETIHSQDAVIETPKAKEMKPMTNEEIDRKFAAEKAAVMAQKRNHHEAERKSRTLVDSSIGKLISQTEEQRLAIERERKRQEKEQNLFDMLALAETS